MEHGTLTRISGRTTEEKWLKFNRDNETKENSSSKKWTAVAASLCAARGVTNSNFLFHFSAITTPLITNDDLTICLHSRRSLCRNLVSFRLTPFDFNFGQFQRPKRKLILHLATFVRPRQMNICVTHSGRRWRYVRLGGKQLVVWMRSRLDCELTRARALKMRLIVSIAANRLRLTVSRTLSIDRWKKRNVFQSDKSNRRVEIRVPFDAAPAYQSIHFYRNYFFWEMALQMSMSIRCCCRAAAGRRRVE